MAIKRVWLLRSALAALLLAIVFGLGLWAGARLTLRDPLTDFPYVVRVAHSATGGPAYGGFEIRDRQTIGFLDALFPNYRKEAQAGPPPSPLGEHHVLEFMLERSGYSKRLFVWSEGNKEYWQAGQNRLSVQGSFRRCLEWLPVRRAIEMAIRPSAERALGRKQLAEHREQFLDVVIDNARRQVGHIKTWAIRDLLTLVERSAPRTAHRTGGYPTYSQIDGLTAGPLPDDSPRLSEIRQFALDVLLDNGRDAAAILALTANEDTILELARRLDVATDTHTASELIVCLQGCLGLPGFQRGGICGNSSHAEFEQFRKSEEKRTNDARAALLAWLADWKSQSAEQRLASVLAAWDAELVRMPHDFEYRFEEFTQRFASLLRRGPAMLSAVESAQATSSDLVHRGALEALKAFWTGRCDKSLVEELLNGNLRTQLVACDVIASSADPSWKNRLTELLHAPRPSDDLPLWAKTVEKAAEALVICHGAEAIPVLTEVDHYGLDTVRYALQHFQIPQGD